ncbi:Gamma-aminobutyric acid receptor subunit beta-like [Strongyloides ratti]|uniref:Gamma-aminobutyric acid receptor subunit beta n=1 Tax=Strongyloides ratti TaxID=34506 RepID=A0A090L5Y3_STRRB|nr:Gamma-aminobutyric acid receptor subunit beta-like [Strongyloides ratti]CEF65127.1 Gamma-aminobutyric acid receptor subunit beta-like [Strongyloides ratti]
MKHFKGGGGENEYLESSNGGDLYSEGFEETQIDGSSLKSGIVKTTKQRYDNASLLLEDLLSDYDIRLRPNFGGPAIELHLDIMLASFDSISEVNMDYTITIDLHQYWQDDRLSWSEELNIEEISLSGEFSSRIWCPDLFLANDKHSFLHTVTENNKMLRVSRFGNVTYGMRFTSTLSCNMDLKRYPLDYQYCSVEIESYGYTTSEVVMKWRDKNPVYSVSDVEVPQFVILNITTKNRQVTTATGSYQRLSLVFFLKRSIGYFIFQTYLPCILIVMLSWVSFWINHEATSARVALGITTVLNMTTISTGVRQSLPRISYIKSIDVYLVTCFVFVFAALLEYAMVNYSYWGRKVKEGCDMTTNSEWPTLFPQNNDDKEGRVNINNLGISKEMSEEIQLQDRRSSTIDKKRPSIPKSISQTGSDKKDSRPMSPIPPLMGDNSPIRDIDDSPNYPRYMTQITGNQKQRARSINLRRRLINVKNKSENIKNGFSRMGARAASVIPKIRVKDVNVIDKHSRVIFPMTFIIFNIFYWGYYSVVI